MRITAQSRRGRGVWALLLGILLGSASAIAGGGTPTLPPAGSFTGRVIDAETREPIGFATLLLVEINRGEVSHNDGDFHFFNVPAGSYTLKVSHLGYQTLLRPVSIPDTDTLVLTITLAPTSLQGGEVVIRSDRDDEAPYAPSEVLSGKELQQQLGRTLAETLGSEAGVAQRSMGPAPARPVVRGLGGDRLLILENGDRTGDLSAGSADHAVTIDPITADRVEIVQGPASLIYTSNALGGVINLVHDQITASHPDRMHGLASIQVESVTTGYSGGLSLSTPAGPFGLQLDGSARRAADISTPIGELENTGIETYNGSLGASYVDSWGYLGISAGGYYSSYGIPGGFTGAHPKGVDVTIDRRHMEAKGAYTPGESFIRRIELSASYNRYHQEELESNGAVGTSYGLLTTEASAMLHHGEAGILRRGTFGAWGEHRDLAAGGQSFLPRTLATSFAGYLYEEATSGRLTVQGGVRLETHLLSPEKSVQSRIGEIRPRRFTNVAGSLAALYDLGGDLHTGLTVMRTSRAPSIEELFSEGPHLAAYTFEVGNPDLAAENGLGIEFTLGYSTEQGHGSLAIFRNAITDYIYSRNTGDTSFRLLLPIYQFTGNDVVMVGGELSGEAEVMEGFVVGGSVSYVEGKLADSGEPLPMIPPLSGKINLRYQNGPLTLGATMRVASAQRRLGRFEEPTEGYMVYDAFAQYQYTTSPLLHTIVASIENITNEEYRMHLSRVKSIMPEPGRNLKVLYRMYF